MRVVRNKKEKESEIRDFVGDPGVGTSLAVQGLRLQLPMQGVWVPSRVRELGYHMPWGQKDKTENRSNTVTKIQ